MSDLFHGAGPETTPEPQSRAAQRSKPAQRRRRRQRRIRSIIIVLVTAALVVGAGYFVKDIVGSFFSSDKPVAVTDFPGPGSGEVEIEVPQGASGGAIARSLVDGGVIATQKAFTDAMRAYAKENGSEPNLQYGTYQLSKKMPASAALAAMLDKANRKQSGVTIREGLLKEQTFEKITSVTSITMEDIEAALEDPEALGLPKAANGDVEGWLAPATYPFTDDTTAEDLLGRMIAQQISLLDELGVAESDQMEVLTKASLVDAEAPAEERGKVAQVIENRLAIDKALEFDSTIHFLAGRNPNVTTTAEQRAIDSPYNTYKYAGLPPGPIANPGKTAIEAVLNPEPGDWLFFVTIDGDTGETKFADTFPEHQVNVEDFRAWARANAKKLDDAEKEAAEQE